MLNFESPVWVRYKNGQYVIRALFMKEPLAADKRYEDALRKYTKAFRRIFGNEKLDASGRDRLLWFQFNPDYQWLNLELDFNYGRRYFIGKITVVHFQLHGYTYVCLPAMDCYFFVSTHQKPSRSQLADEVIEHMQRWPRTHKKEDKTEILLEDYASEKREFCTNIELSLYVKQPKISIKPDTDELFRQFFRQQAEFDGGHEIQKVGNDLNDKYPHELDSAFYRENEVTQLKELIYGDEHVPVVILGRRKVGKTAILHQAVRQYMEENSEKDLPLRDNIWEVDPSRVIAGMSIVGMWQRRMESIINFAIEPNPDYKKRQDKLYFSNLIALFRIGKSAQNNMTLSDLLKPYLQNRRIQLILEATSSEWDIASELDRSFTDLFKVIRVHEPSSSDSLQIIARKRITLEKQFDFSIDFRALSSLIELQKRFHRQDVLIGRVADSLYQFASKFGGSNISQADVIKEFGTQTNLQPQISDLRIKHETHIFREHFEDRIIGQQDAINCMTDLLSAMRAQLNDPERPFGSFLFIGPTGVGKTHAAKVLADYLFTHEDRLVRFDMNEFIDPSAVNRLVGDFSQPEGQLTSKIRFNPYCVLLFDEIEKAHPDVHNLLLQVLGEGRLTDALGRTVSFCNTVIIMTSNLGAERVRQEINLLGREDLAPSTYRKAVMDFFRPEFINRIDQVVIFHRLEAKHIAEIAWLQIHSLLRRHGFVRRHTILNITKEALERIAARGFDPEFGGRALKRQIEKDMTVLLAEQLVETPPQNPVIFNLVVEGKKLIPQLVSLEHTPTIEWDLEDFSKKEIQKDDFERLLERIHWVKRSLDEMDDEEEEGILITFDDDDIDTTYLLELREKIQDLEAEVQEIIWDYDLRKHINLKGSNFQTKHLAKHSLREIYAQMQVKEYLSDLMHAAGRIVDESNSFYFNLHQRINWLEFEASKYIHIGIERMLIRIKPLASKNRIAPSEEVFLHLLANLYTDMQAGEIISFQGKDELFVGLEAPGLFDLFSQEVGAHLLLQSHQSLFPVEVSLHKIPTELEARDLAYQLAHDSTISTTEERVKYSMRLYTFEDQNWKHLWHANRKKKQLLKTHLKGQMTDLQTGIVNKLSLKKTELRLLFWLKMGQKKGTNNPNR